MTDQETTPPEPEPESEPSPRKTFSLRLYLVKLLNEAFPAKSEARKVLSPPLYLVTAVAAMGYGSVVTLFADFRNEYGFSGLDIGLLGAAGFGAGFCSQLFLSKYADRGFARTMVRLGLSIDLLGFLWMANTQNIWQFIAARLLIGIGSGLCGPSIRKVVISRDPHNVGANLGKVAAFDITGFVMGPVLTAVLAHFTGLRWPFIMMAAIYAVVLVLVWREDLSSPIEPRDKSRNSLNTLKQLLAIPGIRGGLAAAVAFYAGIGTFEVSWDTLLDDNGAPSWLTGVALSVFTAPMIIFAPIGGRVTYRYGALKTIMWSQGFGILCVLAYGWVGLLWPLLAISLVQGIADAFTLPGMQVAISTSSPKENIASGQGLLSGTGLAVAALVSAVGGPLYEHGGAEQLYTITAGVMLLALAYAGYCAKDPSSFGRG